MNFEISISIDPAVSDNRLEQYLAAINKLDGVRVHIDLFQPPLTPNCTAAQADWIIKNSTHPCDVHYCTRDIVQVDHGNVYVMGVEPGASGRPFLPDTYDRIRAARAEYPDSKIIVDGGINDKNIGQVRKAGVDCVAVGNWLYSIYKDKGARSLSQAVQGLLDIARR